MSLHFEEIQFLPPKEIKKFINHTLYCGQSGSGKSNTAEFHITQKIGREKVIDLFDDGRCENMLYCMPETNPKLVSKMSELSDGKLKPKTYPLQIIAISGSRLKYINKLPSNFEIMSFDASDLTLSDIEYLFGSSQGAKTTLAFLAVNYGENVTIKELAKIIPGILYDKMQRKLYHVSSLTSILRVITRWERSGMFDNQFKKIDIEKIMNDKNRITSFTSQFLETEDEKGLAYGLILKRILDMKIRRIVNINQFIYIREIAQFLGRDISPFLGLARKMCLTILREGRDLGVTLYADTQLPHDLNPKMRRQFGKHIYLKMDKKVAETLLDIKEIPLKILNKIDKCDVGQGIIVDGTGFYYPLFFPPARHFHKKPHMNVIKFLGKKFGYKDIILENKINPPPITEVSSQYSNNQEDKTLYEVQENAN